MRNFKAEKSKDVGDKSGEQLRGQLMDECGRGKIPEKARDAWLCKSESGKKGKRKNVIRVI